MNKQSKKSNAVKSVKSVPTVTSKTRILSTAQVTPKSKYSLKAPSAKTAKVYTIPKTAEQRSLSSTVAAHHAHAYMFIALWKLVRAQSVIRDARADKTISKEHLAQIVSKNEGVIKAQSAQAKKERANVPALLRSIESDFQRRLVAKQLTSPVVKTLASAITERFNKRFQEELALTA